MSFFFGSRRTAQPADPTPPPTTTAAHFMSPSNAATGPKTATSLELIRFNSSTNKFELGEQALQVLRNTRGPVGVVAVAGRARQGKSYILNQLLGRSGGFVVGPSHRPCTKGLWMWSAPVATTGPDGSTYNLVLLDTEGIDAYDQTGQYSTQIFSLAVLLSSLFIYNQLGPIDEAALDRLSLVTEMTKHIRVRASSGAAEDPSDLAAFTPAFIWLLRDFYLKLEEDGRAVTPRDYLETALQSLSGNTAAIDAKNQVRTSIKSLFPDRDCFTLVRPVNDEDALARLDSLPSSSLRPEFRDGLSRLTRLVFNKAQPKRLGSQVLTGPLLAGLAEAYCAAINAGAVPTIATAWQGVAESECRRAADAAEQQYTATLGNVGDASFTADEASLEAAHQKALADAQRVFDDIAIGDESIKKANEQRFIAACTARFRELKERKLASAALACERAINEASVRIVALARQPGTTLDDLRREVAAFESAYTQSNDCSGPQKWPRFAQFMRESFAGALQDLASRQDKERAAAAAAAQQQAQQALGRVGTLEAQVAALTSRLAQTEAALSQERQALTSERQRTAALESQILSLRQAHQAEREKVAAEVEQQARSFSVPLEQRLHAAESELESLRRQAAASLAETRSVTDRLGTLAAERDAAHTQLSALNSAKLAAEHKSVALQNELDLLKHQMQQLQAAVEVSREQQQQQQQQRQVQAASWSVPQAALPSSTFGPAAAQLGGGGGGFGAMGAEAMDGVDYFESPSRPAAPNSASGGNGAAGVNTAKMTINEMKAWLMSNGHEAVAWELANKKAKKADWAEAVGSRAV